MVLLNINVGATMSLVFDWSNPVRVSKSVLGFCFDSVFVFRVDASVRATISFQV